MANRLFRAGVWLLLLGMSVAQAEPLATSASGAVTPYGAQRMGDEAHGIPIWQGDKPERTTLASRLLKEKPLYTIDQHNLKQHQQYLAVGMQALFDAYPESMRLPVYPSHRYAYYPQWVYDAIAKNKQSARLIDGGNSLVDAWPGIPFPKPKNGYQVLWNHLMAFKGGYIQLNFVETTINPGQNYSLIRNRLKLYCNYYDPERAPSKADDMYVYYLSEATYPPKIAGGALLVHERINPSRIPRQAWSYLSGQRKVMRVPSIDYDSPMRGSEAIRFADEVDIYNGSIDRYKWTLEGKQNLIVPYNNEHLERVIGVLGIFRPKRTKTL